MMRGAYGVLGDIINEDDSAKASACQDSLQLILEGLSRVRILCDTLEPLIFFFHGGVFIGSTVWIPLHN